MASRTLDERIRQPYQKGAGLSLRGLLGQDNGGILRAMNAAGSGVVDLAGLNTSNQHLIGGAFQRPLHRSITFYLAPSAGQATQRFFIAPSPMEIRAISVSYATADGGSNTAFITKEGPAQVPGSGVSVMTGTFNMSSTINTAQWAVLPVRSNPGVYGVGEPAIALNTGEMLSLKLANAPSTLAGVAVTVYCTPSTDPGPILYNVNANGSLATQYIGLVNRYVTITGVQMVWSAPGTDPGAVTFDITHETGTTASGAGNSILSVAQSMKGVANTPVNVPLSATASRLLMAPGDRLSVKPAGTLTGLQGVVIVVSIAPTAALMVPGFSVPPDVTFADYIQNTNASQTNQAFFGPSDQDYEIADASFVWGTAGSGTINVTIDPPGTAPGAGATALTDVTTTGTNTVAVGIRSVSRRALLVPAGGLLSVKYGGTLGTLANVAACISLSPI
jgi:hypothetical protein